VTELAWHHHFNKNMFIEATGDELASFVPDITIVNSRAMFAEWKDHGLRSETCVAIDVNRGLGVVTGTEYSGEMKKGAFSMMNYLLPLEGIMSMHCSATVGKDGDTAIFFGLSGTGKTTLSADPTRQLIGDDEHGWDDDGVFNLEGGCYAKMIDLNPRKEPLIHAAIKRDALLENVVVDENLQCLYSDGSRTENTRGSYPMHHIPNSEPSGKAGHASNVIFLTCDAFGVLPPVSRLTTEQALYHLVTGYTAKVAGTEQGITEPTVTFSQCFGGAFMPLPAKVYAQLFQSKIEKHNVSVYLVNTGWSGGAYGVGKRMDIVATRQIVASILDGSIKEAEFSKPDTHFQLSFPTTLKGVAPEVLDPSRAWGDKGKFEETCAKLSSMFAANFRKHERDEFMQRVAKTGPGGDALLQ
ncbi:phosphoenolpyruvate carboxykinase, partial [Baffinella frigidus]